MRSVLICFFLLLLWNGISGFGSTHGGKCGTKHEHSNPLQRQQINCMVHECDHPDIRDQFTLQPDSEILNVSMNLVYFGVYDAYVQSIIEAQLKFFNERYIALAGISYNITVRNVSSGPYTKVDPDAETLHNKMAAEYYVPNSITVLATQFSPNPNYLLGYAYLGQNMLLTAPEKWFAILDSFSAISPTGTTLIHEVGHLFSLFHTFTDTDTECIFKCREDVASVDRNIVGDMCNDTMPASMSFTCDKLDTSTVDCNGDPYGPIETLPQHNFMSYTPDACQNQFTTQQVARMRCYLSSKLSFVLLNPPVPKAPPLTFVPVASTEPEANDAHTNIYNDTCALTTSRSYSKAPQCHVAPVAPIAPPVATPIAAPVKKSSDAKGTEIPVNAVVVSVGVLLAFF